MFRVRSPDSRYGCITPVCRLHTNVCRLYTSVCRLHYTGVQAACRLHTPECSLHTSVNKYSLGQFIMVDVDAIVLDGAIYGVINIIAAFELQRKRRRSMVRPWLLQRPACGAYNKLFSDLLNTDEVWFRNFIRMGLAAFEDLLHYIKCGISKNQTHLRQPISEKYALKNTPRMNVFVHGEFYERHAG